MNQIKPNLLSKFQLVFSLFSLVCALSVLSFLPRLSIPLGISYVMALILRPLKPMFIRANLLKRIILIAGILFGLFLFIYPITSAIYAIQEESSHIQEYMPKLEVYTYNTYEKFQNKVESLTGIQVTSKEIVSNFILSVKNASKNIVLAVPKYIASILEWSFLIPLFLFFMLKDGKEFKNLLLEIVPNEYFERVYNLIHQFNKKFGDYIFAKFMEASMLGSIITIGLLIIGYPFAFLLGILAGLTNVVPYLGPFLGFVPALVIGIVDQSTTSLSAMIILYIIANVLDLALVFPVLVSKIVNLHPIIVVISVIVGSQFAGVLGMVISIPVAALLKLIFSEIYREIYPNSLES